jgi:cell division protein FtsI/penicillin-binding protein 2
LLRTPGIHGAFAPGSVAKLAVFAAAIEIGLEAPKLGCPPILDVSGVSLHNAHNLGSPVRSLDTLLAISCNTAFAQLAIALADRVGMDSMARVLRSFGSAGVGAVLPTQTLEAGSTTARASLRSYIPVPLSLSLDDDATAWEIAQAGIGQGGWSTSPMALARFIAAIGNDGREVQEVLDQALVATSAAAGRRIMKATTARRLRAAMALVTSVGTARSLARGAVTTLVPGGRIIGKTGTPQRRVRLAGQVRTVEDAVFAGLVELSGSSESPLAVVAFLEEGASGAAAAAPLADSLAAFILTAPDVRLAGRAR